MFFLNGINCVHMRHKNALHKTLHKALHPYPNRSKIKKLTFFFFVGTSSFYFLEITATQIQDIEVYLSVNVVLKAGVTQVSHKDLK